MHTNGHIGLSRKLVRPNECVTPIRAMVMLLTLPMVILLTLLASDLAMADGQGFSVSETIQFDTARPVRMDDGCGYPSNGSVQRKSGMYTFTLKGGDVGRCPGDDQENYGSDFRERVMINGVDYPKRGTGYRFSALVRFDPETRSADSTVFFQVHQWRTPECSCYPIIMIYMMADGTVEAETSSYSETSYRRRQLPGWNRTDFEAG